MVFCTLLPVEGSVILVYSVARVLKQSTSFTGFNLSGGKWHQEAHNSLNLSQSKQTNPVKGNTCFLKARTEWFYCVQHWVRILGMVTYHTYQRVEALVRKHYWQKAWQSSLSINWSFRPSLSFINQFWVTVLLYGWPERDTERTCQDSRSEVSTVGRLMSLWISRLCQ